MGRGGPADPANAAILDERRLRREAMFSDFEKNIWGASPSPPPPEVEDDKAASISADSDSDSSTDSEEERRRRRRKKEKKNSSHKSRKSKKEKRSRRRKHSSSDSSDEDEPERKTEVAKVAPAVTVDEDEWVEKVVVKDNGEEDLEDAFVGPTLGGGTDGVAQAHAGYGGALLPGEGDAMAKYVKEGQRIPRRGEIGMTSEQISSLESDGWVMSGSRHRRMEAVRLRKENQVYSAEERVALAKFNLEERQKRENEVLSTFRKQIARKVQDA